MTDGLTASFAVSYLDATYDKWPDGPCNLFDQLPPPDGVASCQPGTPNPSKDVSGQELIYAPEWSGNFILDYVYPFSNGLQLLANLTVAFTTEYSTRADNDPRLFGGKVNNDWDGLTRDDSAIKSDPFAKLDLRLGLGGDRWEVAVIGKNLTDETTVNLNNRLPTSDGSLYRTVERERYFLVQASYGW